MVLALLAAVVAVVTVPIGTAVAADRPLASTPLITWNMDGANQSGSNTNKWQNNVRTYARQAQIVMLQEVGPGPAASADALPALDRITVGRDGTVTHHAIQHYRWNVGGGGSHGEGDGRADFRDVYFALTQNGQGGRVNLAIVVDGTPDEVNVVQNPVEAGRIALGVRYGRYWYFTVHGLSPRGNDSAVLVNAIDTAVDDWGRTRHVDYQWTVGGDFNREPDVLSQNQNFPPATFTINTPVGVATHNDGGRYDFFVTDDLNVNLGDAFLVGEFQPPSDHRVVGIGRMRAAGEQPPEEIKLEPLGDDLTQGAGSSNGSGFRGEIQDGLGKMTSDSLFGHLPGDSPALAPLWPSLSERDLVGSRHDGRGIPDTANEGWPSFTIDQLRHRVANQQIVLVPPHPPASAHSGTHKAAAPPPGATDPQPAFPRPNVVTLLAGTNDMLGNVDVANARQRLGGLIDEILTRTPDAAIVVGTLPPSTDPAVQSRIDAFNSGMRRMVDDRIARGDHLVLVDLSAVTTSDLVDEVHPGDQGYQKMAEAFLAGIYTALVNDWVKDPVCGGTPSDPGGLGCGSSSAGPGCGSGPSDPGGLGCGAMHHVMVVGDSISNGFEGDDTWRYRLWQWAQQQNWQVTFVGPLTGTEIPVVGPGHRSSPPHHRPTTPHSHRDRRRGNGGRELDPTHRTAHRHHRPLRRVDIRPGHPRRVLAHHRLPAHSTNSPRRRLDPGPPLPGVHGHLERGR
ncbi:GDSL-type esterase/lipase family protein [Streptomyces rubrisoli]|uniref:GDSL-type esterase/lipase family protein n=1 Tax=Streptantibioticus rubrisoli TaxID=1387313 RepID=A0ABT1P8F7_9ACTN|nr:GDSL-type esterase/lipase family protein [Streptantibioticus rubrisoli]MCQ4041652.1 GDSL-type esterase/lipase family protein [Streptantibioticus rubrisoli]